MGDWKDIIVNRIKNRKEKEELYEVLLNQIDIVLSRILNELSEEYHMKAKFKKTFEDQEVWVIVIENEEHSFRIVEIFDYYKKTDDLQTALINLILDNFYL